MNRRFFLGKVGRLGLFAGMASTMARGGSAKALRVEERSLPVRQLTSGHKQHWFGYYDKWQVDRSGRFALGNQVELFFRSPRPDDVLKIGLIDLERGDAWTEIGETRAWGWQQGCMLQWIPGSSEEVMWNDRGADGSFVCRIYNIRTKEKRDLPRAIYTLSPDGSYGLSVDFGRLQYFRPGYGYAVTEGAGVEQRQRAPDDNGIFRVDLRTGEAKLIISLAQIAAYGGYPVDVSGYYHWFNHLLINPGGTRFIFLNRSRPVGSVEAMNAWYEQNRGIKFEGGSAGRYLTRAFTANTDGSEVYDLSNSSAFSHFIWKGDGIVTAWSGTDDGAPEAFYEFTDRTKDYRAVDPEAMPRNGHNTYVPGTNWEWILNDTYPMGEDREQELYLYHEPTRRKVVLGRFFEPEEFRGEWRCDLHPRCDQQGRRVFFDSTHKGGRRQMYAVDIGGILG